MRDIAIQQAHWWNTYRTFRPPDRSDYFAPGNRAPDRLNRALEYQGKPPNHQPTSYQFRSPTSFRNQTRLPPPSQQKQLPPALSRHQANFAATANEEEDEDYEETAEAYIAGLAAPPAPATDKAPGIHEWKQASPQNHCHKRGCLHYHDY